MWAPVVEGQGVVTTYAEFKYNGYSVAGFFSAHCSGHFVQNRDFEHIYLSKLIWVLVSGSGEHPLSVRGGEPGWGAPGPHTRYFFYIYLYGRGGGGEVTG